MVAVIGTRPEAIKMAPVIHRLRNHLRFEVRILVTGQHKEMLEPFLRLFDLTPNWDLGLMKKNQSLAQLSAAALAGTDRLFERERPDFVLVQGDTTTAFIGALTAYYHKIPVGHIEAGLRTGDRFQPYPEEVNRKLIGVVADLHFAPTWTARENLLREGVADDTIFVTGNTVVDALLMTLEKLGPVEPSPHRMVLVTAHRRENWGEPLKRIARALNRISILFPDVQIVFPIHKNPLVRRIVGDELKKTDHLVVTEPPDYEGFVRLLKQSYLVVTDSGGIQEEAPTLGKPVLVLRDKTERPEAVEAGVVRVIGTREDRIVNEISRLLTDENEYRKMQKKINPYGDGAASERIVQAIGFYFGWNRPPQPFRPMPSETVRQPTA